MNSSDNIVASQSYYFYSVSVMICCTFIVTESKKLNSEKIASLKRNSFNAIAAGPLPNWMEVVTWESAMTCSR